MKWGKFCEIFGATPRSRIIEFFLEMRELDFTIGDIARETGLNRATAYNVVGELAIENYVVPSRRVSSSQLYKLNPEKKEVKMLVRTFDEVLRRFVGEYKQKEKRKICA